MAGSPPNDGAGEPAALALDATLTASPRSGGAPATADRSGRYGRYEILGKLGAGGMGVVYRANDPVLDRHVALKVIGQSQRKLGSTATDRLVREARALAKLAHPNVIAIHDVGQVGDEAFVAMELVHGRTLDEWLRVSPRTTEEIIDVFVQASHGLEAAHGAGLVHRDFKPSNVIIGDDGRVRVLDFGLARLAEATDPSDGSDPDALLGAITVTGGIVGTPAYMAPEQCGDGKVDERCDQFSFCVTLYQALYGCLPFSATTLAERNARIAAGELAPPANERDVPERVRAAVLRGLAADPNQRYASMKELAAELAWRSPPPIRPMRRRRALLAGGLVLLAIAAVVAIWSARRGDGHVAHPAPLPAERLRMVMIDNTSVFPAQLSEHVRNDADARRLDITPDDLQWTQPDGTHLTEQYVSAPDKATLEGYLAAQKDIVVERGHELLLGRDQNRWRTFYVWKRVELDGSSIRSATVSAANPNQVTIELDAKGANLLAATTGQNIGRRIATVIDGTVSSAFIITGPILGGVLSVTLGGKDASSQERAAAELARNLSPR